MKKLYRKKWNKKRTSLMLAAALLTAALTGCGAGEQENRSGGAYNNGYGSQMNSKTSDYEAAGGGMYWGEPEEQPEADWNTEEYDSLKESNYRSVKNNPISTFSADVDTASYTNVRRMIEDNYSIEDIPQGAVRIEEMLNYFRYDYDLPTGDEPFGVTTVIGDCPWNEDAKLLQIGLRTEKIDFSEAPPSNLVFLLDVSGSMNSPDKLPLLQSAFTMLAEELTEKDRVSVVTYAGYDEVLLEGEKGSNTAEITAVINDLSASGSTNGSAGIQTAYRLAEDNFIEGGNNRVILATDGDLNVGVTSESELKELVEEKRESGIYLSVLGFGTGNIKDNKMETLADNGNGNYAYIDSRGEARKVMVEEMGATLVTVAKDVKLQVEFNPAYIKGYRLIGYENRVLATEDFDDDTKDAGEIGAGHIVTALYEIITTDSPQEIPETDLKYQSVTEGVENGEWASLKIRYKEPDADESILKEYTIAESAYTATPGEDFCFAAAVAEFGLLVRGSEYKGQSSFAGIENLLNQVDTRADDYRDEFAYLVKKLKKNSPIETGSDSRETADIQTARQEEKDGMEWAATEVCGYPLAPADISVDAEAKRGGEEGSTEGNGISCEWDGRKISLELPEGWKCEKEEYSDDIGRFGIRFAPEGQEGWIGLYYYKFFGVCGTGLVSRDITFDSGLTGSMGTYDEADTWSYIVFPEMAESGTFVALSEGAADWLGEYGDDVLNILDTAVMEEAE